ncbi:hypothetical protein BSB_12580 [Bacillus stercoris]|nr:hypothetical protein BSB_12580 [Bacillus stercoris]
MLSFLPAPLILTQLNVIDDVTAVGSDTFMFSESGYVIEFFHDGDVTIGKAIGK